jgi:hypothetical protein
MMQLPENDLALLRSNLHKSFDANYEFEILLKCNIDKDGFQRMITYLQNTDAYVLEKVMNREQLDVRTNNEYRNIRMSIYDKENILNYCKFNKPQQNTNLDIIKKERVQDIPPLHINEYMLRVNVNKEDTITQPEMMTKYIESLGNCGKYFRYKKRYTFMHANHKIDLSIVKSSKDSHYAKNMLDSKVLKSPEIFEVEVEALQGIRDVNAKTVLNDMLTTTAHLLSKNEGVDYLLSKTQKYDVIAQYINLINKSIETTETGIRNILLNPIKYYLRYQPVTLTRKNLLPAENIEYVSIRDGYSITEKADGERLLLFVDKDKQMFTINNKLNVVKLGITHKSKASCIIDGEYVAYGKYNLLLNVYLSFDVYFVDGEDVRANNLTQRLHILEDVIRKDAYVTNTPPQGGSYNTMDLQVKKFYTKGDIFDNTRELIQRVAGLPYHTDGYIYTPIELSPGALYKNDTTISTFGGSWNKVFKWKPPEENSIDVLVKFKNESLIQTEHGVQRCIYVEMFVAYKGAMDEDVNIMHIYQQIGKIKYNDAKRRNTYTNDKKPTCTQQRLFDYTYLPIDDNIKRPIVPSTKEPLAHDTIVEFTYNKDNTSNYNKWIPLRIRHDKTTLYNINKTIANTANAYTTAMNVWMTIIEPVDINMITGNHMVDEAQVKFDNEHLYYVRGNERNRSLLKPMLEFHNFWVKRVSMFDKYRGAHYKLLDIGCGRAGDLQKWISNKYSVVVGVDNNVDNLLNGENGAYKRMYDMYMKHKINFEDQKIMFLLLDGGKTWNKDMIQDVENEQFKRMAEIAIGGNKLINKDIPIISEFRDILNEDFNLVSCQFAIHYFFESVTKLETFCANIDKVLSPGGSFIGTCLDGFLVNNEFMHKDTHVIKGEKNDCVLWQIERKYDYFTNDAQGDENIGKRIDVYVETINKIIPEYLVDFNLLQRKFKPYNIILQDAGSFQTLWRSMVDAQHPYMHTPSVKAALQMDNELQRYSFMNRWFIFTKLKPI